MQINPVKVKLSKFFVFVLSLVNKMYNLPRLRRRKSSRFIAERNKVKNCNQTFTLGSFIWSIAVYVLYRRSYMSVHVLLNLLNKLRKRDKMRGLPSILSLFRNEFHKLNNTRGQMLDSIKITLKSHFCSKNIINLSLCA